MFHHYHSLHSHIFITIFAGIDKIVSVSCVMMSFMYRIQGHAQQAARDPLFYAIIIMWPEAV